jgi:hypothetical protein
MESQLRWKHLPSLFVLLAAAGVSLLWSLSLARNSPGGMMGFPGIYYGTRCLMHHCDPYNVQQLTAFSASSGAAMQDMPLPRLQAMTLYVNLPTTSLFVAPFAALPLQTALMLWNCLLIVAFLIATLLMWQLGAARSRGVALLLASIVLANCEVVFSGGNTAGFVVALCVIAVWCFLQSRLEVVGVLCLAAGLAMKPHDAALIWLYFLLAGGSLRKRALQAAGLAATLAVVAAIWVSFAAPHWLPEMRSNLAAISAPGGINEPGPSSIGVNSADMIIDLQTVFSIVRNEPGFYNTATYLTCGAVLLFWTRAVLRARFTPQSAWFALVSVASLSMLITYHRSYDAKLLLIAIPACAVLWSERGKVAWVALALTGTCVMMTADIPLTVVALATEHLPMTAPGVGAKLTAILLGRPAPLLLFATALFYLWVFVRRTRAADAP